MDISHLVVNGCSFTYGAGLQDPRNQVWPGILANRLGLPIVNLARSGTGNDTIHRRTYEYFYEDIKNNNNPFYVICLSSITREEYWSEEKRRYEGIHVHGVDYGDMSPAQKNYVNNFNIENSYRRTMLYYMSLKNLFEAHKVPYLMFTLMHLGSEQTDTENKLRNTFPNYIQLITEDKNNLQNQDTILKGNSTKIDCGHYDYHTNERITDYLIDHIYKNFNFVLVNKNFLSLANYTNQIEPHYNNDINWQKMHGAWM